MVAALLDTSIAVDLLRKHLPAENWLLGQNNLGVTRVVWFEVVDGVRTKVERDRAVRLLKDFELVEFTNSDIEWALDRLLQFRLSHNVDSMDCLIAAPAYRLQLPLYTQNVKHFQPLLGALAQKPY